MVIISKSKVTILFLLFFLCRTVCVAASYDIYFDLKFDTSITVENIDNKLCKNPNKTDEIYFMERNIIKYNNDSIYMNVISVINSEKSHLLSELARNSMIKISYATNSSWIDVRWNQSLPFLSNNEIVIKEYIKDAATEYYTDYFDFYIKKNDTAESISKIGIQFINVFSSFVEKNESITQWNRDLVRLYSNQNNPGIEFYYLVEETIKNIKIKNPNLLILGTINDNRVRLRSEPGLNSKTIKFLEKNEIVQINECISNNEIINGKKKPWIKVKTLNDETGYVYGEYLDISVSLTKEIKNK